MALLAKSFLFLSAAAQASCFLPLYNGIAQLSPHLTPQAAHFAQARYGLRGLMCRSGPRKPLQVVIGNTYQKIPHNAAKPSVSGQKKVHDWTLYVRAVNPEDNARIKQVTFELGATFSPNAFAKKQLPFQTRQQSYAEPEANVQITTNGGQVYSIPYEPHLISGGKEFVTTLGSSAHSKPAGPNIDNLLKRKFGIELECSLPQGTTREALQHMLPQGWKVQHDASIRCPHPGCVTAEIVSPILRGPSGLQQVRKVCRVLAGISGARVDKSTGFHVHVDVGGVPVSSLRAVCQNFVKYEDAIDMLVPPSRRHSDNVYARSNRENTSLARHQNKKVNEMLASCTSVESLATLMNPGADWDTSRRYKLNLQNLVDDTQQTLEFRQHSGTLQYSKISNWICFVVAFTDESIRAAAAGRGPDNFKEERKPAEKFSRMFEWVVKDKGLMRLLSKRVVQLPGNLPDCLCLPCQGRN